MSEEGGGRAISSRLLSSQSACSISAVSFLYAGRFCFLYFGFFYAIAVLEGCNAGFPAESQSGSDLVGSRCG